MQLVLKSAIRNRLGCHATLCIAWAIAGTVPPSSAQPVGQSPPNKLPAQLEEILGWLPEDTESLMVASGPYRPIVPPRPPRRTIGETKIVDGKAVVTYRDADTGKIWIPPAPDHQGDFLRMSIEMSGFNFLNIVDEPHLQEIARQPLRHAVLAGRRFKSVTGIPGGTPFDGCAILWFERPIPKELIAIRTDEKTRTERIADQVIASIATREEWGDGKSLTLYFANPKSHVLLVATDREFLRTMLSRIKQPTATRALPADRAEWQNLDVTASMWGIRREINSKRGDDSAALAPASDGLTYFLTSQPKSEIALRLRSTERTPDAVLNRFFESIGPESDGKSLVAAMVSEDTAEARLPMNSESLLVIHVIMGHVVNP